MPTWQQFLEVRLKICVENWVQQKQVLRIFALNDQDMILLDIKLYVNGSLRLKSWVSASMLDSQT